MDDFILNIFILFFKLAFLNLRSKPLATSRVASSTLEFVVAWSKMFLYTYMSRYETGKNDDINLVTVTDISLSNSKQK